ncbi:hypothetical protein [Janibacter melonis]|uniref:hypothetical protein n=1 Tax=Janibacter melonis TaxID=262209 RepID=UPI0020963C5E|nr:hypothetical protein [Janibacter melonis]
MDADDQPDVGAIAPMPTTRISQRISTGTGADRHVAIRSSPSSCCARPTRCSAPAPPPLLADETLPSELAFEVRMDERAARISTTFEDGIAYGRLVGQGFDSELPQELDSADALPDLLVRLIAEAGAHRPVAS